MRLGHKNKSNFILALAALGIVFGNLGTSPMYAVSESMRASTSPHSAASVFGVTTLIFWTLALIVSVKYLLFITRVDNDGEGGIFAIVSVINSKVGSNDSIDI